MARPALPGLLSHPFLPRSTSRTQSRAHRRAQRTPCTELRAFLCFVTTGRGEDVIVEVVVRGVKSDELRVRAAEGELPQEGRALRGLRLPGSPDEHLLSSETSLQFCLEEAQGSSWH